MKGIILLFMISFSTIYTMPMKGNRIAIKNPVGGNLISASERLTVNARVEGSVISASKFLDVNSNTKNVIAAAGEINIAGDIDNILVSVSKNLTVNGDVGESIVTACDSLLLNGTTGDVVVAAREVDITGEVDNLYAAADRIYVSGTVRGNLYSTTNKVELVEGGEILGEIHSPKELPKRDRGEMVKKGWSLVRMVSLVHSFFGILVITLLLKRTTPDMVDKLSKTLFKKGLAAFFVGLFFLIALPIFTIIIAPIIGMYSVGIMLGCLFTLVLSKAFLVAALSRRYNYSLSLLLVVALSFFHIFNLIFSIIGLGIFLIFLKENLAKTPELQL